jgi:murein endopeptidase
MKVANLIVEDRSGKVCKIQRPLFAHQPHIQFRIKEMANAIYWVEAGVWIKQRHLDVTLTGWLAQRGITSTESIPFADPLKFSSPSHLCEIIAYVNEDTGFYCGVKIKE